MRYEEKKQKQKQWENMTCTRKEEEVGMGKLATEVPVSEQGAELTKKAVGRLFSQCTACRASMRVCTLILSTV